MFSKILTLQRSDGLNVLIERRTTWIVFYALMALIFELLLHTADNNVLFYPGSGIVLAALLILPRSYLYDLKLLFGLYAVDLFIKTSVQHYQFSTAAWLTFAFMLQSWIGAYLIYRFSPRFRGPSTYIDVINFLFLGCLIPVVVVNNISAYAYWLQGEAYIEQWLAWSSHRGLSIVLIAPILLFVADLIKSAYTPYNSRYSWFAWFIICVVTLAIFLMVKPNAHELIIYSFLLIPIFSYCAVNYSLVFNSFLSLSVGLIILFYFNWVVKQNLLDVNVEHLSLTLFVFVNQCMLLLVSSVIFEREQALVRSRKIAQMYEILSSVNQMLVGLKLSEIELFKNVCEIITKESDFISQTCISISDDISSFKYFKRSECIVCNAKDIKGCNCIGGRCVVYSEQAGFINHLFDDSKLGETECLCSTFRQDLIVGRSYVIYKNGQPYATLTVLSCESDLFDDELDRLFKGMAGDISFALEVLAERIRLEVISEAFEHAREAIVITDKDGDIINVNPSFSSITGYSFEEVIGKNPRVLKSGKESKQFYEEMWESIINKGHWTGEFCNKRKSGDLYIQRGTISSIKDDVGNVKHIIGIMEDVTERKQHEQHILRLSNFDILTGLPNRKMLKTQFLWKLNNLKKNSQLAVLFIDLDNFKHVNDAYGHQLGDSLLVAVVERMDACISKRNVFSRFGGDEFVLLFEGSNNSIKDFSEKIIELVSKPYFVDGQKISVSCSIGISVAPRDSMSLDELIGFADAAMYKSKSIGRATYSFFSPYMRTQAIEKVELKHELEDAVDTNQFVLFYQPKVNVDTDEVVGFEALVRWQHPTKGLLSPGEFISIAEESGQIVAIDYWVLEAVINQISKWKDSKVRLYQISVNLSLSIFKDLKFIDVLKSLLEKYDVQANLIDLELTERVAMVDFKYTLLTLKSLKRLGVSVSIDDFGTGYSSLAYLRDFPIDTLKIDRAFIIDIHSDKHNQGIVSAILAISKTMGMKVVAEGVENVDELSYLKQSQCDYYQGYLYSKPVSVSQMESIYLSD